MRRRHALAASLALPALAPSRSAAATAPHAASATDASLAGATEPLPPAPPALGLQPAASDGLPAALHALKRQLHYPLAWTPAVTDLAGWRASARARVWQHLLQPTDRDDTPFAPAWGAAEDRGSHTARRVQLQLTADSGRVTGWLLEPPGAGPAPGALLLHDHGARFDIGKEKLVDPGPGDPRRPLAQAWARRHFGGRFLGQVLAERGFVVLALDAPGWGDRGPMDYEAQQALASQFFQLGGSLAGTLAAEDVRAARFLAGLPRVDARRVAAIGFSMGAFRAWQLAALSDAVTAGIAVCWMATAAGLVVPGNNQLRGQSAFWMNHPGLQHWLDHPDVASLAAPKPMYFLHGAQDTLFPLAAVTPAFERLRAVWQAHGVPQRLALRIAPQGHACPREVQDEAFDWLQAQWV